jgi:hypothetical protein
MGLRAPLRLLAFGILASTFLASSGQTSTPYDGLYQGTPTGNCPVSGPYVISVENGLVYTGTGHNLRGPVGDGTITYESTTGGGHRATVTVHIFANSATYDAVEHGPNNCVWHGDLTKTPAQKPMSSNVCVTGCKRWSSQLDFDKRPVCALLIFCPLNGTPPFDADQTAPALPRP